MKTLFILDLDETLWHTDIRGRQTHKPDAIWNDEGHTYKGYKRPHVDEFLDFIFDNYDVAFFTAATQDYADYFFVQHFGQDKFDRLVDRQYRESCSHTDYGTFKDMQALDVPHMLSDMVLIDDTATTNDRVGLIRAQPYYGSKHDDWLKNWLEVQKRLSN